MGDPANRDGSPRRGRIAEYARRSGARAARVCEIQVTIGGLLPLSWHRGSSAHILVLPNQPKPASQPGCSIQNSCMHDRSERFSGSLLPGRSHQVAACMPCCLALPCTPAIQVVRSVQLSQIRRSVKSIDQSNPSTLATYSRSAFHATHGAARDMNTHPRDGNLLRRMGLPVMTHTLAMAIPI